MLRLSRIGLQLLPEAADMDVHGADVRAVLVCPDGVEQVFPGKDPVGIAHQVLDDVELLGGQVGKLVAPIGVPGIQIQTDGAAGKLVFGLLPGSGGAPKKEEPKNELVGGSIRLDLDGRNAYRGSELADLTAKEFDVIEFLMRNPNRVYSRENLLDTIWAYEYRSDIRTVDVHIRRLREKLEENPAEPKHIMTKWGVGYYFKK